jgi:excisionase family DNA binding protein
MTATPKNGKAVDQHADLECITTEGLSVRWNLPEDSIRKLVRLKRIPHFRIGKRILFPVDGLRKFMAEKVAK